MKKQYIILLFLSTMKLVSCVKAPIDNADIDLFLHFHTHVNGAKTHPDSTYMDAYGRSLKFSDIRIRVKKIFLTNQHSNPIAIKNSTFDILYKDTLIHVGSIPANYYRKLIFEIGPSSPTAKINGWIDTSWLANQKAKVPFSFFLEDSITRTTEIDVFKILNTSENTLSVQVDFLKLFDNINWIKQVSLKDPEITSKILNNIRISIKSEEHDHTH